MSADLIQHAFNGQAVRVITDEHGEPWFVATDVARILGYAQAKDMLRTLDEDEKGRRLVPTPGGDQEVTTVSEPGLYKGIVQRQTGRIADSETAGRIKAFQRWVTHELLPEIRRTGQYAPVARLTKSDLAHMVIESEAAREAAEARVLELTPRAEAFDAFLSTAGDYSVNEAAKILSRDHQILTGERRLRDWMFANRWCYRDSSGKPRAYQAQVETGRLVEKAQWHYHPATGEKVADAPQVRVTPKGIGDLARLLVKQEVA